MSDSPATLPPNEPAFQQKRWLPWLVLALGILGPVVWFAGPPIKSTTKQLIIRHYAEAVEKHMAAEDWNAAGTALAMARRWGPDEPRVLRLMADFLVKTRSDPTGLMYTLRRLEETGQATTADRVHLGEVFLNQNNISAARTALLRISDAERVTRLPLELEASILRHEGRIDEAESTLRRALLLAPEDPAARFRLAVLDYQAAFPEMRQPARQRLWDLARGKDKTALAAIEFLAASQELTSVEADQLLGIVEAHPAPTPTARFRVVSARLRLRPHTRPEVVEAEIARYQGRAKSGNELPELLTWLNQEREHERVLKLLPNQLSSKSAELLHAHLEALGGLNRWADIVKILSKPAGLPVSGAFISLWMANAFRHVDKDTIRARQQLITAYEASGRGKDGMTALRVAQLAEDLSLWDIASLCYAGLAEAQRHAEIPMLEKVREMSLRDRDTQALVDATRRLAELRPTNPAYGDSLLYLRLVAGDGIELRLQELDVAEGRDGDVAVKALSKALAAYRIGDIESMRQHLPQVADPAALPPGQRAVYAGLLNSSGKVGPAFEFAEKVPEALLLDEELRFLRKAR